MNAHHPAGDDRSRGSTKDSDARVREVQAPYESPQPTRTIDDTQLDEIVARVVKAAQPDRIILFGSALSGKLAPDSDVDLLVIKSAVAHRGRLEEEIYMSLFGVAVPVDVIVATPEDVERLKDSPGSVIAPAMREGRTIYVAP